VLVIAESYTRCGAILHWISAERRTPVFRASATDTDDLRYVDIAFDEGPCRVLGATPDALHQPFVQAFAAECDRILVVGSAPVKGFRPGKGIAPDTDLADALVAIAAQFKRSPLVSCIFPRDATAQAAASLKHLKAARFALREAVVDAGAFTAIWRELCTMTRTGNESGGSPPEVPPKNTKNVETKGIEMANAVESLNALMQIDGAVGGLIADYQSGMLLAKTGGGVNLEVAAAGNSEVIKSKMKTMQALGIKEGIEDILITLGTQYHVLRPLAQKPGLFLYLVLDKAKANLAMARFKVSDIEKTMAL
jgi:hypothetical protein